ncbi:MFS transporter [Lonsdalea quercina]|uniref:MFS transporter n=1 Tax=Lonsdalea quercina TaxID=71657 RepID=UPI003F47A4A0
MNHVRYSLQLSSSISAALFGMAILALGMGLGRFLFTPMLPVMLSEKLFTFDQLSYLASANYAGYLFGSLLFAFSRLISPAYTSATLFAAAIATAVLTFAMALTHDFTLTLLIRFTAGIASAGMMIFGSLSIMRLTHDFGAIAALYAGVGVGIIMGNEYVVAGQRYALDAETLWWGAGLLSALLLLGIWLLTPRRAAASAGVAPTPVKQETILWWQLALLYGLAGFGYIIVATYLPLIAKTLAFPLLARHLWSLVGLGIIPGCFIWLWAAGRWGTLQCLTANLFLQGACVLLTLVSDSPVLLILSSIGFGATFMGTTSLVMPLAKRIRVPRHINLLGLVTLTYGIGQIAGPLLTSALKSGPHAVVSAIVCGAIALFIASGMSYFTTGNRQCSINQRR